MRLSYLGLLFLSLGCAAIARAESSQGNASTQQAIGGEAHNGAHDFDFLYGSWRIHNRRLSPDSHEWETFEATHTTTPVLGGLGNMDEFVPKDWHPGFIGLSLRLFSPTKKLWSIYWINNRTVTVETPVVGTFDHGVGVFVADDEADGKPIKIRYKWSDITPTSARWEFASSADGGNTWETTWVMEFMRVAPSKKK